MVFGIFQRTKSVDHESPSQSHQASDNVLVTSVTKRPRAIVVIFGHLGADADQMESYAELYQDYKCSTICATAPILSIASNDTTTLGEVAITACRETARLVRTAEMSEMGYGRVPIVVHVLGNGGAKVLEEMEQRIHEVIPRSELLDKMDGTATACSTPFGSRRNMMQSTSSRNLMKSSSARNLMQSSSGRNLMDSPSVVNSTSSPMAKSFKGSTQSGMTATSLSEGSEEDDSPVWNNLSSPERRKPSPRNLAEQLNNPKSPERRKHSSRHLTEPLNIPKSSERGTYSSRNLAESLQSPKSPERRVHSPRNLAEQPNNPKSHERRAFSPHNLSEQSNNVISPDQRADTSRSLAASLDRLRLESPSLLETNKRTPNRMPQGYTAAPGCVITSPRLSLVTQCFSAQDHEYYTSTTSLDHGFSPRGGEPISPQPMIHGAESANPLQRQLQRRRRRKKSSPHVKRIDMERSGLTLRAAAPPRYNAEDRAYQMDIELFASRLIFGSIVFDSGPYYPSVEKEMAAVDALLGPQNPGMRLLAMSAIVASYSWQGLTHFNYLGYVPADDTDDDDDTKNINKDEGLLANISPPAQFWKNMQDLHLSKRHAYIYSQADKICERDAMRNLIKKHKLNGIKTIEIELIASKHLQHRRRRCDKYSEFVERILNSLEGRRMDIQESVNDWFDSDEEDGAVESGHEIVQQDEEEREANHGKYNIVETHSRVGAPETVAF